LLMHSGSDVFGSIYVVVRKRLQGNFNRLLLNLLKLLAKYANLRLC
jgi:hypothetical protein